MSIRLIKISKDLNVGISSLVEFLHKKGFDVESNPNTKIDSGQQELLIREFGDSEDLRAFFDYKKEKERAKEVPKEEVKPEPEPVKEEPVQTEIKTEIPESIKPHVQVVDKIDLDALNRPKKVELRREEVVVEPEEMPVIEEVVEEIKVQPEPLPEKEVEQVIEEKVEIIEEAPGRRDSCICCHRRDS